MKKFTSLLILGMLLCSTLVAAGFLESITGALSFRWLPFMLKKGSIEKEQEATSSVSPTSCGDNICQEWETVENCPHDCGEEHPEQALYDCKVACSKSCIEKCGGLEESECLGLCKQECLIHCIEDEETINNEDDSIPAHALENKGTNCKIISVTSSDYQWIWGSGLTPSEVCTKEGLECRGVEQKHIDSYLDKNSKIQCINTITSWLSSYYCKDMAMVQATDNQYTQSYSDYAEPYAGLVDSSDSYTAVLCC
ncbi:MAG: hypothetical protein U9Q69_06140 [Nanoarchaeota archaeon]|nr:hypothetical protein [Nanoarchaeota archaeon]